MKIRKRVTKIISDERHPDIEISGAAIDDTIEIRILKAGYLVGYLVPDECSENPFDCDDGLGVIARANRDASTLERKEYFAAQGRDQYGDTIDAQDDPEGSKADPDAVMLDCYDHGGQKWSIHGQGTQCAWDTSNGAGVWVPNKTIRPDLEAIQDKEERRRRAVQYAKDALYVFNAWLNGETYGYEINLYDKAGKEVEGGDACYGFYGCDDATAGLLDNMKPYEKNGEKAEGWQI